MVGRDAILKQGRDASMCDGFVLTRLGHLGAATVAIEQGRARGVAEGLALSTTDPKRISNVARRERYEKARRSFIDAWTMMNAPLPRTLSESERRYTTLEYSKTYSEALNAFKDVVTEVRAARDPDDFLLDALDATTILQAASSVGEGHAVAYVVPTAWGGVAVAALSGNPYMKTEAHFAALDLPELTDLFVSSLVESQLSNEVNLTSSGFARKGIRYCLEILAKVVMRPLVAWRAPLRRLLDSSIGAGG